MTTGKSGGYSPFIAAAVIMAATVAGMLLMPRLMLAVSGLGGGPVTGAIVAVAFILVFFGVLWLRGRYQAGKRVD